MPLLTLNQTKHTELSLKVETMDCEANKCHYLEKQINNDKLLKQTK